MFLSGSHSVKDCIPPSVCQRLTFASVSPRYEDLNNFGSTGANAAGIRVVVFTDNLPMEKVFRFIHVFWNPLKVLFVTHQILFMPRDLVYNSTCHFATSHNLVCQWYAATPLFGPVAQGPVVEGPVAQGLCGSRALWLKGL